MNKKESGKLGYIASVKSRKEAYQKRITQYYIDPKKCKYCDGIIPFERKKCNFCNRGCSTRFYIKKGTIKTWKETLNYTGSRLEDIFSGKYPEYTPLHLKHKLIKHGYKKNKCEICGIECWNNKLLSFELDHINGNSRDHRLENLRIVCPNCHSQTETFKGRNRGNGRVGRRKKV
jgi:hypothetical protein